MDIKCLLRLDMTLWIILLAGLLGLGTEIAAQNSGKKKIRSLRYVPNQFTIPLKVTTT